MNPRLQKLALVGTLLLIGFAAVWRTNSPLGWLLIPGMIAAAWMLGDPRRLLAGYWLWASTAEYVYQTTGYGVLRYGDEGFLGLIVLALMFNQALQRRTYPDLRTMVMVFFAMTLLWGISHVVNGGSRVDAVVTAVQYFRPFLLGFFAYTALRPEDLPGAAKFFLLTLGIQLVMNLAWLLDVNPFRHPGIYVGLDFAVGTMGSSLMVGYTACLGIVLCLGIFLCTRRVLYLSLAGLVSISLVLTNTVHAYAFLGLMLIAMTMLYSHGAPVRVVIAFVTVTPIVSVLVLIVMLFSPSSLSLRHYIQRGTDLLTGRKIDAYRRHFTDLPRDVPVFLLGAGPANLGTAMASHRTYLAAKYHGWSFTGHEFYEVQTRSIIMHTRTGFLAVWGDFGPIVFLLYWGAHVYAMIRVVQAYRRGQYSSPWQKGFALSFLPAMSLYLLVAFMTDLVHSALWGTLPWVWASTVWTPQRAVEQVEPETTVEEPAPPEAPGLLAQS